MLQRARALLPITLAAATLLAACGDDGDDGDGSSSDAPAVESGEAFPDERCAANEAAGTVTFLTGFDYAAAASIIDVITADANGYYDELCLDVEITSSFSTANYALVAGGQGQFASGGSFSEVAAFAQANDADLVTVMVDGRSPIDTLLLKPGTATELADLAGTTIGVKGKLPSSVEVMLLQAGLSEAEDFETVPVDGFDPVAHFAIDSIVGVPGWRSNEPGRLEREGVAFDQFDAADAGVPGSFGAIFTSQSFIDEHPTAAEDFVRATLRGLATAIADPDAASAAAVALIEAGGNPNFLSADSEQFRWRTEAEIIAGETPDGVAPGTPDIDLLTEEVETYAEIGLYGDAGAPDVEALVDASFAEGVTAEDGTVVWPAP
ncbi:MAG: ABC transporter substrate-binding protein [Ilumatobacteraceae bacterium]|nr:ABC transporter substrate-binding protein [Ilumatobacteraceae bacterium]